MKIVFISSMLPSGHYSQIITSGLTKLQNSELIVYTEKNPKNLKIENCGLIKSVWSKSPMFIFEIVKELLKDKPDIVHIQQEFNMYGGIASVILFPLLLFVLKILNFKIIITLHAAVYKKKIDEDFIETFNKNPKLMKPFILECIFYWTFIPVSFFSDAIIVHTNLLKDIIIKDYFVNSEKVSVIPAAIPEKLIDNTKKENYFFYFGYMVRRKGLGFALEGFRKFIEKSKEKNWKLVLAGGVIKGQEESLEEIKKIVRENKLENNVEFKGFIEEEQIQDELYRKAYAVVIPAKVTLGSSGPLYHANSHGKCVIATKEGHFIEDIEDLKTGILTENDKWAEALEFAVENPDKVKEIEENVGVKARLRSPKQTALVYLKLYESLL